MATITIKINERTKAGKALLEMARLLSGTRQGVEIEPVEDRDNLMSAEEAFYENFRHAVK